MDRHAVQPAQGVVVGGSAHPCALVVPCMGALMVAVNAMIVNVALPSIGLDLHFSETSLTWVVNAYLVTFGGFRLLGGRLGDFFDHRLLFLFGIAFFTLASLGCGLADSRVVLVVARAAQGLAGAIVSAVTLLQIINVFPEGPKRARALGLYVFVSVSGGIIGLLLGGALTSALSWRWIFLVNVPIGAGVCAVSMALSPHGPSRPRGRLDVAGAVTASTSLMLAICAALSVNDVGWHSAQTLGLLAAAAVLLGVFLAIETSAQAPLLPLKLFRTPSIAVINIVAVLFAAAVFSWCFVSALHLQLVLGLSPLQIGLAFFPANFTIAVMSLVVTPVLVTRFGTRRPLAIGMLVACSGLVLLARLPVNASFMHDVLPGMLLLGVGVGMAYHPVFLCALTSAAPCDAGAVSGIVNTSYTMGGALGLSVLASIAAARTDALLAVGVGAPLALAAGYQVAFYIGAALAALAALISGIFIRDGERRHQDSEIISTG